MTIHHPFADGRRRVLGLLLLDLGFTPKTVAARFGTNFQSLYLDARVAQFTARLQP